MMIAQNKTFSQLITPTITAGAYSAGDVVGGLLTFSSFVGGGGGTIRQCLLVDDDNQGAALTLYLFDDLPSTFADNAAFAPTVDDLKELVTTIDLSTYTTLNSNKFVLNASVNASWRGRLYGYLVCTATPTYVSTTGLTVKLTAWID